MAYQRFIRFTLVGMVATLGNLMVVEAIRNVAPFRLALVAGVAAGFLISFISNKVFTFQSKSWVNARHEAIRFALVHSTGAGVYWLAAIAASTYLLARNIDLASAERLGALTGCAVMMVVTYVGHNLFTFKERRRVAQTHSMARGNSTVPHSNLVNSVDR